jgi:ATP synthase protein I
MQPPQSHKPGGQHAAQQAFDDSDWTEDIDPPVRPLTRQEAQALVARHPSMSVWRILVWQAAVAVLVALVWGVLSQSPASAVSALYGGAVVVIPNALMARGIFGRGAGRSVGALLVWELLKLGLSGAMLALSPVLLRPIDWAAMLVTLVLCLKVIGVVLLLGQGRAKKSV